MPGPFRFREIQLTKSLTLLSTSLEQHSLLEFQLVIRVLRDMILINQHFVWCGLKRLFILTFELKYKHVLTVSSTPPAVVHKKITADSVVAVLNATSL